MHLQATLLNPYTATIPQAAAWARDTISTIIDLNRATKVSVKLPESSATSSDLNVEVVALISLPLWLRYGTIEHLFSQVTVIGNTLKDLLVQGFHYLDNVEFDYVGVWKLLTTGCPNDVFRLPGLGTGSEWILESDDLEVVLTGVYGPDYLEIPKSYYDWANRVNLSTGNEADLLMVNLIKLKHDSIAIIKREFALAMADAARNAECHNATS
jgi:hypothetical protein